MRLLENNIVELSDAEWLVIREQLSESESKEIIALYWSGNFERTGNMRFKSNSAAMMFFLRWL
jgi:hypothetical protein